MWLIDLTALTYGNTYRIQTQSYRKHLKLKSIILKVNLGINIVMYSMKN